MAVNSTHPQYKQYEYTWRCLRDASIGSGAIKSTTVPLLAPTGIRYAGETYLPRPAGMTTEAQYAAYRDRAIWFGATERAVNGLAGAIFRRPPTIEAPAALEAQLHDVTQSTVSLARFAERIVRETLLMGRAGILVDFPEPTLAGDGGLVPPEAQRPYWVAYTAEEILNWRTVQRQGDTVLSLVVLRETVGIPQGVFPSEGFFEIRESLQYRVLRLNEDGLYEVSVWGDTPGDLVRGATPVSLRARWVPERNGLPLDFIPFQFCASFSLEPDVEKSLFEGLVEINYQHYRHSADYEHGLHLTALPTPWITGQIDPGTQLLIGSATAWIIPDPTAKVGLLEFRGQGLQSHERAMETDIKNMALLGAKLLETAPSIAETATSVMLRSHGGESPIQSLIHTVSDALTDALQIHAWWAGMTEDLEDSAIGIALNDDLVAATVDAAMLRTLMELLLNGTISYETFYYNLQRGEIARPMIPVEDEQAQIALEVEARPPTTPPSTPSPPPPPGRMGAPAGVPPVPARGAAHGQAA